MRNIYTREQLSDKPFEWILLVFSGLLMDFDGFELISRVHAPQTGEVFVTCKADSHLKMAEHFGIWRAKFGVEWNVLPVFNDEEVIMRNKQLAEELAAMG